MISKWFANDYTKEWIPTFVALHRRFLIAAPLEESVQFHGWNTDDDFENPADWRWTLISDKRGMEDNVDDLGYGMSPTYDGLVCNLHILMSSYLLGHNHMIHRQCIIKDKCNKWGGEGNQYLVSAKIANMKDVDFSPQ